MTTLTLNYRFTLPDYDQTGWNTAINNNLIAIDAILGQFNTGIQLQGLWQNSTMYSAGVSVIDSLTSKIWTNGTPHTSIATPGTFAADRNANPSYWTDITNPAISAAQSAANAQTANSNAASYANSAFISSTAAATSATSAANSAAVNAVLSTFRNRLINGALDTQQRGTSFSTTTNTLAYTADRFFIIPVGYTATTTLTASLVFGSAQAISIAGTVPAGSTTDVGQCIESLNCYDLVSKQVTFQFWSSYSLSAGTATFAANLSYANAKDVFSTTTLIQSVALVPTGVPGLYTATFAALPSNAANGLRITVRATQATATGSFSWVLGSFSLEAGAIANTFERRPIGVETALCQRYYQTAVCWGSGYGVAGGSIGVSVNLPVSMRINPAVTVASASNSNVTTPSSAALSASSAYTQGTVTATGAYNFNTIINLNAELV